MVSLSSSSLVSGEGSISGFRIFCAGFIHGTWA